MRKKAGIMRVPAFLSCVIKGKQNMEGDEKQGEPSLSDWQYGEKKNVRL